MTAHLLAREAYAGPHAAIRTTRDIEYDAFARVTRRLKRAQAGQPAGFAKLAHALHENRTLWTTLAADLVGKGNGLPAELRARLFYLAEFTVQHSQRVLAGLASADALIDVNSAVMRGLRGKEVTE